MNLRGISCDRMSECFRRGKAMLAKELCRPRGALRNAALAILLVASGGAIAATPLRWERTNAPGLPRNLAIAVCLPGDEIVCVGVGCRDGGGYDFVQMIAGDWLLGPTRLSAGAHVTTTVMNVDQWGSRAMNLPVSRGPISSAFLRRLVGHKTLRVQALKSGYEATFPLAGFGRARRMLRQLCVGERATS